MPQDHSPDTFPYDSYDSEERFSELQEALVGEYIETLQTQRERIERLEENANPTSQDVARSLALDSSKDPKVRKTLHPVVEDALRISVDENPSVMAGILFPMIGEAVRKAVAASTQQMMDSTNDLIANSLSAERIGWRVEAWRSGKSFAEIAMAHTLSYRVEHIYVIHRTTGLLLGQATNQDNLLQDSDMVVGMLTAIQDFVRDSFTSNKKSDLDVIQVGEFKIWLQHGPIALLAAVISGQPKPHLRELLVQHIEDIHRNFQGAMARFENDGQAIPGLGDGLDECLVQEARDGEKKQQSYTKFKIAGWIVLVLLLAAGLYYGRRAIYWNDYTKRLRQQPGIVVVEESRGWTTLTVRGFRDPMAIDPMALLHRYHLSNDQVLEHWEPYYSLDPHFVSARRLKTTADIVRNTAIRFQVDATTLSIDQLTALDQVTDAIQQLAVDANQQGRELRIQIIGHTDSTGSSDHNDILSQDRAESILHYFVARGIEARLLSSAGMKDSQSETNRPAFEGHDLDRRVTFSVDLQ